MFHNYFFLRKLSDELLPILKGSKLVECFSQNKDELILSFLKDKKEFYVQANFEAQTNLLNFPESFSRARRNSVDIFPEHLEQVVEDVIQVTFDRSFYLLFKNGTKLLFKLHGRQSNILFWQRGLSNELFRKGLKNDLTLDPEQLSKNINLHEPGENDVEELKKVVSSQYLSASSSNSAAIIDTAEVLLNADKYYIYTGSREEPALSLIPKSDSISIHTSAINACQALYKANTRDYLFGLDKNAYLKNIQKEIKKSKNYIEKNKKELAAISEKRSLEEIANIVMANLHQIDPKSEEVTLDDFYLSKKITIKIRRDVTPQKYAENLYRKAKNQKIQISKLKENIASKETVITSHQQIIEELSATSDFKSLRSIAKLHGLLKKESGTNTQSSKPFNEIHFKGYQILIGKNAKSNDILTSKYAHKDDLWLHARDVSGSHVVVKNDRKETVPTDVLEYAAAIAAFYSKRKNDSLCPVIYTPKKYVRKRKGAAAGAVVVDREKVILVKPQPIGN